MEWKIGFLRIIYLVNEFVKRAYYKIRCCLYGCDRFCRSFRMVFSETIAVKFNTGLCFFLLGTALYFHENYKFKIIVNIVFAFVLLMGFLTLVEYIYGVDLRIDELFWNDVKNPVATSNPGRMSPATAFCFFMIGTSLLFIRNNRFHLYVQIALFLSFLMAFHGLSNHIFGYGFYKTTALFSKIAPITAITLIIFSVGVFFFSLS